MRAPPGFDRANALERQRFVAHQKLGVFFRENVVGHRAERVAVAQGPTEREHQRGLAAADGAADADGEGALLVIAVQGLVAFVKEARVRPVFMVVPMVGVVVVVVVVVSQVRLLHHD